MRAVVIAILFLGIFWIGVPELCSANDRPGECADGPTVQDEIRDLERLFESATLRGDRECRDDLLAPDFRCITAGGRLVARGDYLRGRVQGLAAHTVYAIDELDVRVIGDAAISTGVLRSAWAVANGRTAAARFRVTHVWIRRDGTWRAASAQLTEIVDRRI